MAHYSELPSIVDQLELSSIIEKLKAADLSKLETSYIRMQIDFLFKRYIYTTRELDVKFGKFYRAIKYDSQPGSVKKLSYPPREKVKLQRANFDSQQRFYCSGDPRATFFELGLKAGDKVVLSQWALIKPILISPIGYSADVFKKLHASRLCPTVIPNHYKGWNESTPANMRITNFFYEIFTQPVEIENKNLYKITAVIADRFLKNPNYDIGLAYPAIQVQGNCENFAFTPKIADNYLKLEKTYWYLVKKVENYQYSMTQLAISTNFSEGLINWDFVQKEELFYFDGSFSLNT